MGTSAPDICISYAREDAKWVGQLAAALEATGRSVFWDLKDRLRGAALKQAQCIVVVWSEHSIGSDEVQQEAYEGSLRHVLIPVTKGLVRPAYGFKRILTTDLTDWSPGKASPGFEQLLSALARVLGGTEPKNVAISKSEPTSRATKAAKQIVVPPPPPITRLPTPPDIVPTFVVAPQPPAASPTKSQAFLSYTRLDDRGHDGGISALRAALELQVQIVTGDQQFEIFQDVDGIAFGQHWPKRLDQALAASRFLIPVLSPGFFKSEPCRDELRKFLTHEQAAGRDDLILPIYLVEASVLERPHLTAADELAAAIAERQRWDWRPHAFAPPAEPAVRKAIRELAQAIAGRLEQ